MASTAPEDKGNVAYSIMFWQGMGNLFPWNAFITAAAYFGARFCGTLFEENFENFFSITFMLSQTIGLALAVKYQNYVSLKTRIVAPLYLYSSVFVLTTVLVLIDIDPTLLFVITLLSTCVCGVCGAVLSGGLFGFAGVFPPQYTSALMSGQGLAGLVVSVSSILTILAAKRVDTCSDDGNTDDGNCSYSIDYSALAYFIIATIVLLTCAASFAVLYKLPFSKYVML